MPETFGARLRQQREARQIDLVAIAETTKIKLALLEALERDDVSAWPSGIFRRAYIRAYAQFIGLDADAVVAEFMALYPDPEDVLGALAAVSEDNARRSGGPPTRLRNIVDSALGSLARFRRSPAEDGQPAESAAKGQVSAAASGTSGASQAAESLTPPAAHADTVSAEPRTSSLLNLSAPVTARVERAPAAEAAPAPVPQSVQAAADESRVDPRPVFDEEAASAASVPQRDANEIGEIEAALEEIADVCVELGRAIDRLEIQYLLGRAADALAANGLIVWVWDGRAGGLRPLLAHGYPAALLAQLPVVRRDEENATAAAFRSERACEMAGSKTTNGALALPLITSDGCAGVLAIELKQGVRPSGVLRSFAALVAAALTQLVLRSRSVEAPAPVEERMVPTLSQSRAAYRTARVRRALSDAV